MAVPVASWVPFVWPAGWTGTAALRLLAGSPFNCLLLPAPAASLRAEAIAQGFACPDDIRWQSWRELDWAAARELAAIGDGFWPGLAQQDPGSEPAGPTGNAWLDANGWLIEMARVRAPESAAIWVRSAPPEDPRTISWSDYELGLIEAWAYGARRPLDLAAHHAAALLQGSGEASAAWHRLLSLQQWMNERAAWGRARPYARLAIASDFTGANEYIATETLLLAARLGIAFVPVERSRLTPASLLHRRALLWCDPQPVPASLRPWVEQGGVLLAMREALQGWPLTPAPEPFNERFQIHPLGKGRLALAPRPFDDPWLLARDAHLLMSRRHDAIRLFNAGSLQFRHAHDGARHLVHLINYTRRPAAHVTSIQFALPVRSALLHVPGHAPRPLTLRRELGGWEAVVPPFALYSAVEFEEEG